MKRLIHEAVNTYIVMYIVMYTVYEIVRVYNPTTVITVTVTSDTCFAIHTFFAVTTHPAYGASCYSRTRLGNFSYLPNYNMEYQLGGTFY